MNDTLILIESEDLEFAHVIWNSQMVHQLISNGYKVVFYAKKEHLNLIKPLLKDLLNSVEFFQVTLLPKKFSSNFILKFLTHLTIRFKHRSEKILLLSAQPKIFLLEYLTASNNYRICLHAIPLVYRKNRNFRILVNIITFLKQKIINSKTEKFLLPQRKIDLGDNPYIGNLFTHGLISVSDKMVLRRGKSRLIFIGNPREDKMFKDFQEIVLSNKIKAYLLSDGKIIENLISIEQEKLGSQSITSMITSNDYVFCAYGNNYRFIYSATLIEALSCYSIVIANKICLDLLEELDIKYRLVTNNSLILKDGLCLIKRK